MTVLFLDFDGVLHPQPNDGGLFSQSTHLWELLRREAELFVVFSTGWRFEYELEALRNFVCRNGGEDLTSRFIDTTPLLRHPIEEGSREKDCLAWLSQHPDFGDTWLALDDMPSLFTRGSPNLYQVNHKKGLMHYDVERISSILKRFCGDRMIDF